MTLEPSRLPLLPLLEMTPDRADAAPAIDGFTPLLRHDLQWQTDRPVAERLALRGRRLAAAPPRPAQAEALGLREFVELPPDHNPRTLEWAAALRRQPALAQADAARAGRRRAGPPARAAATPTRWNPAPTARMQWTSSGSTASWASASTSPPAMVVVLRAMDVPARIVTGYQGTDRLPVDGYYIVRQSNAHAWVEFWQPGDGWMRVDPTAAVAPDRIVRGAEPGAAPRAWWPVPSATSARSCWPACAAHWRPSTTAGTSGS